MATTPKVVLRIQNTRKQDLVTIDDHGFIWANGLDAGTVEGALPDNLVYTGESDIAPPFIDPSEGVGDSWWNVDLSLVKQYITAAYNAGVTETDFGPTLDLAGNAYRVSASYIAATALISEDVLQSVGDIFDVILAGGGE